LTFAERELNIIFGFVTLKLIAESLSVTTICSSCVSVFTALEN